MSAKNIPTPIAERLDAGLKRYRPILDNARNRDVGEADTVTIIKDMLSDIFGYDKYEDITSEFAIRGTYVDLAIKLENVVQTLVEVKAIGCALKENHAKQAIDYAANQGVDWVILTNGQQWQIYHVIFAKPISAEMIVEIDLCKTNPGSAERDTLYLWCKEGWRKSVLGQYRDQKQALSKFLIGSTLFTEPVLAVIRKELRRITPDVKIEVEQIALVMAEEVVKREIIERGCYKKISDSPLPIEHNGEADKKGVRRKNLDLLEIGIAEGQTLNFIRDPTITVTVVAGKKVLFAGETMSLSAATAAALNQVGLPAGPGPATSWKYQDDTLEEIRIRFETRENAQDPSENTVLDSNA